MPLTIHFYKTTGYVGAGAGAGTGAASRITWKITEVGVGSGNPTSPDEITSWLLSEDEFSIAEASYPAVKTLIDKNKTNYNNDPARNSSAVISYTVTDATEVAAIYRAVLQLNISPRSLGFATGGVLSPAAGGAGAAGITMPRVDDSTLEVDDFVYTTKDKKDVTLTVPAECCGCWTLKTKTDAPAKLFGELHLARIALTNKQNCLGSALFGTQAVLATVIAILQIVKISINGAYSDNTKLAAGSANLGIDITTLIMPAVFALFSLLVDYSRTGSKKYADTVRHEMKKIQPLAGITEVTEPNPVSTAHAPR